jgi:hypothetical protein
MVFLTIFLAMSKTLKASFIFYKAYIIPSLILNFLLIFLKITPAVVIIYKIFIAGLVFLWYQMPPRNDKLIFYYNLGLRNRSLFGPALIYDLILIAACLSILFII